MKQILESLYEKNVYITVQRVSRTALHRIFLKLFSKGPVLKVEPFSSTGFTKLKRVLFYLFSDVVNPRQVHDGKEQ